MADVQCKCGHFLSDHTLDPVYKDVRFCKRCTCNDFEPPEEEDENPARHT